jgi:hypothetical protein
VSPARSGEQAGVPASAGTSGLISTGYEDLVRARPDVYVLAPDEQQLVAKMHDGAHVKWYADGAEDEPKRRGRPKEGITDRETILAALAGYTAKVRVRIRARKNELEPVKRGARSLQEFRAGLIRERAADANAAVLAEIVGVDERTIRDWRHESPEIPAGEGDIDDEDERADRLADLPPAGRSRACADRRSRSRSSGLRGLMGGRRLVDAAGDRLEVGDRERPRIGVAVPADRAIQHPVLPHVARSSAKAGRGRRSPRDRTARRPAAEPSRRLMLRSERDHASESAAR